LTHLSRLFGWEPIDEFTTTNNSNNSSNNSSNNIKKKGKI
jgi:hypothetical protein